MEDTNPQELEKKWKMEPAGSDFCGFAEGVAIQQVKSLKIDETTREIVIFTHNLKSQTSANEADAKKRVAQAKTAFGKEGMSRSF